MDNELICLPESSIMKNCPKTTRTDTQPPSSESTSTPTEISTANNTISPSDIPLPLPDKNELAEPDESVVMNSESPALTAPDGSAHEVNPHIRWSTRVRKPSAHIRRILEITQGKLPKGIQGPTGSAAIAGGYDSDFDLYEVQSVESAIAIQIKDGTSDDDPTTLTQAMARPDWPKWKEAIDGELALMAKYDVWDVFEEPNDTNIIGCRWVFRIKRDSSGKILK